MSDLFGATRSVVKSRYAVLDPAGFAGTYLPGWEKSTCQAVISPVMGARFCQYLITLEKDGQGRGNTGKTEYAVYMLEGNASVTFDARRHRLEPGNFVYIPPERDIHFQGANARLLIFQKRYKPIEGVAAPKPIVGHQREVKSHPLQGRDEMRIQALLPDTPGFDLAVNVATFQPGAALPSVETQVMERGMLMLQGQGVCRLDADYHPVKEGDVIWAGSYCPRWFVAMGRTPASYIYYQDVNRDPM